MALHSHEVTVSSSVYSLMIDEHKEFLSVLTLRGQRWLNDQIMAFFFQYLESKKFVTRQDFLFVSPQVTQLLKMSEESEFDMIFSPLRPETKRLILFPLNDNDTAEAGGSHWSLLV